MHFQSLNPADYTQITGGSDVPFCGNVIYPCPYIKAGKPLSGGIPIAEPTSRTQLGG